MFTAGASGRTCSTDTRSSFWISYVTAPNEDVSAWWERLSHLLLHTLDPGSSGCLTGLNGSSSHEKELHVYNRLNCCISSYLWIYFVSIFNLTMKCYSSLTIICTPSLTKHAIETKKIVPFSLVQSDLCVCVCGGGLPSRPRKPNPVSSGLLSSLTLPVSWFLLPWHNLGGVGLETWSAATAATLTPGKYWKSFHLRGELPSNSERNQHPFHYVSIYKYVTISALRGSFTLSWTNRTENTANQGMLKEYIFGNHL